MVCDFECNQEGTFLFMSKEEKEESDTQWTEMKVAGSKQEFCRKNETFSPKNKFLSSLQH